MRPGEPWVQSQLTPYTTHKSEGEASVVGGGAEIEYTEDDPIQIKACKLRLLYVPQVTKCSHS